MNIIRAIKGSPLTRVKGFAQDLEEYSKEQEGIIAVNNASIEALKELNEAARAESAQASNLAASIHTSLS